MTFLCMNGVDICAPMSPLNFLKKIHQVCPLQSVLRLLTRDWPISSHFWVISCIFASYFHSETSMFHCTNMFYFAKYSLQAPALACARFHLVCNSFSLVVELRLSFMGSGSHVESTWCDYVMVEAESHLKLLPTSILDIYKVIWHIDMLFIGIW